MLLGETTANLVRDAVMTEPLELSLRGKPNPVTAYRLMTFDAAALRVSPVTSTDRWSAANVSWTGWPRTFQMLRRRGQPACSP